MKQLLAILPVVSLLLLASCEEVNPNPDPKGNNYDRVFILAMAGFNNLNSDINSNIEEVISSSGVPMSGSNMAFLIFEHMLSNNDNYSTATSPHIIRVYRDFLGRSVRDTILTLEKGAKMTDPENILKGLSFIAKEFPSDHYGLMLSSHGTGWLPEGYYRNGKISGDSQVQTFSFGEERFFSGGKTTYSEIDIEELRDAIPMHLDYLIFDACLMGGIEVAYEFKDKAYAIGFSVTEILSEGFDYGKLLTRLLVEKVANPEAVCRDYYEKFKNSSATVTFLYTSKLDKIAEVCKTLFSKYRNEMKFINASRVQPYFRGTKHYYYDLLDIMDNSSISDEDRKELIEAIDNCVSYKEATSSFLSIDISNFCGFSMYLPAMGKSDLNNFYKTLDWNEATNLVE